MKPWNFDVNIEERNAQTLDVFRLELYNAALPKSDDLNLLDDTLDSIATIDVNQVEEETAEASESTTEEEHAEGGRTVVATSACEPRQNERDKLLKL